MTTKQRPGRLASVLGVLVFLLGIAVILVVLSLAYGLFRDPALGQAAAAPGSEVTFASLGTGFARLLVRIVLLFLGSISGSLIANKGIRLYFAALGVPSAADAPPPAPDKPTP